MNLALLISLRTLNLTSKRKYSLTSHSSLGLEPYKLEVVKAL